LPNNLGDIEYEDEDEEVFLNKIKGLLEIKRKVIAILSEQIPTGFGEYPNIAKPHSVPDAIEKLLATEWGRKMPRILNELHSALATNAVHVRKETLGSTLTKMVRGNRLSRVKRNGVYAYTLPLHNR